MSSSLVLVRDPRSGAWAFNHRSTRGLLGCTLLCESVNRLILPWRTSTRTIGFAALLEIICVLAATMPCGRLEAAVGKTVIESDHLTVRSSAERNFFYFRSNVRVQDPGLVVTSDYLEIEALRGTSSDAADTLGEFGAIQRIVATGNVVIEQAGRRAVAGRAELRMADGVVILTGSPRVYDQFGEVSGWRITLDKGSRRAVVESAPPGQEGEGLDRERPTVKFDALPDLGFSDLPAGTGDEENVGDLESEEDAVAPHAEDAAPLSGSPPTDSGQ